MKKIFLILILYFFVIDPIEAAEIEENPIITIATLDGKIFDLREKIGKVVIINFWAEWCIDCRKEMPILEEIYQKYKSQGLEIIGISIDRKSQRKKVLEISSSLSYPNAMFYEMTETSFEEPSVIPATYVIDQNGKFIKKIFSDNNKLIKQDFENILKPLLRR